MVGAVIYQVAAPYVLPQSEDEKSLALETKSGAFVSHPKAVPTEFMAHRM